jgi:glycosyltransferase involved in cell wall biosynthesis
MRIGVLIGKLDVAAGGSHTYSMQILNYLEKNSMPNIEFTFICGSSQLAELSKKFNSHIVTYKENAKSRIPRYIGHLISLLLLTFSKQRITRERIQNRKIISTLEKSSFDLIWSIEPLSFVPETPYMTTVWDLEHRRQPYFPEVSQHGEWKRRETGYSKVLAKATYVVTGTRVGKEQIEKFYGVSSERIIVAPFPIFPNSESIPPYRDPHLIFYPAQFWPHKNHVNLLLGFKLAVKLEPELRLVLVGSDKGNSKKIQQLVLDLNLENNVEFWGTVDRDVLENLYRTSSLMIYPSLFGPDNLPPLEAISFGCPVAVADQPGSHEQFLGGVPLFDATDEEAISTIILGRQDFAVSVDYFHKMLEKKSSEVFFEQILGGLQRYERIARNFAL